MYSKEFLERIAKEDPERAKALASGQGPSTQVAWTANALSKPKTLTEEEAIDFQKWYSKEFMGIDCAQ